MTLYTHPEDRKAMATAIASVLHEPSVYMRMPTCAYKIGPVTVNKDGTIESESAGVLEAIKPMLVENGWLDVEPDRTNPETDSGAPAKEENTEDNAEDDADIDADEVTHDNTDDEPDGFSKLFLRIPARDWTVLSLQNFIRIMYTKQRLINRMAQLSEEIYITPEVIERMEDTPCETVADLVALLRQASEEDFMKNIIIGNSEIIIMLPYDEQYPDRWSDVGALMTNVIRFARNSTRIHAEIQELGDNEKYMANAWLNRIGFGGPDYKDLRRRFMKHLKGYAAFRNNERMLAHKEKLAAKRKADREANSEVSGDANMEVNPTTSTENEEAMSDECKNATESR